MKAKFTIPGEPQGKGRPRFARLPNGKTRTYTPKETELYENLIVMAYRQQYKSARFPDDARLDMRITAYYQIPASASKRKKHEMEVGVIRPAKKPDSDNLLKCVADALNKVAYRDDAMIVDCQVRKFYSHQPRVEVTITEAR